MKKQIILGLFILLLGMMLSVRINQAVSAASETHTHREPHQNIRQQAAPTLIPTTEPVLISSPTPENRVLPPVGRNAGLVIGASVLVLIIIGGVLSARSRQKH